MPSTRGDPTQVPTIAGVADLAAAKAPVDCGPSPAESPGPSASAVIRARVPLTVRSGHHVHDNRVRERRRRAGGLCFDQAAPVAWEAAAVHRALPEDPCVLHGHGGLFLRPPPGEPHPPSLAATQPAWSGAATTCACMPSSQAWLHNLPGDMIGALTRAVATLQAAVRDTAARAGQAASATTR